MAVQDQVRLLAQSIRDVEMSRSERQAQALAVVYRDALLRETPGDLGQAQFLCIVAAVLGRLTRDMVTGDPAPVVEALAGLLRRHAGNGA